MQKVLNLWCFIYPQTFFFQFFVVFSSNNCTGFHYRAKKVGFVLLLQPTKMVRVTNTIWASRMIVTTPILISVIWTNAYLLRSMATSFSCWSGWRGKKLKKWWPHQQAATYFVTEARPSRNGMTVSVLLDCYWITSCEPVWWQKQFKNKL